MTPQQIALVRDSFATLAPAAVPAARQFYDRLFTLYPAMRPLFRRHLEDQGRLLMQALGLAVAKLDCPEQLGPLLTDLGRRHASYGVEPAHYAAVGQALLDTLAAAFGAAFTPALRDAWAATYDAVATAMQAGAAAGKLADALPLVTAA